MSGIIFRKGNRAVSFTDDIGRRKVDLESCFETGVWGLPSFYSLILSRCSSFGAEGLF